MVDEKELVALKAAVHVALTHDPQQEHTAWLGKLDKYPVVKKSVTQCLARIAKEQKNIQNLKDFVEQKERQEQSKASSPVGVDKSPLSAESMDSSRLGCNSCFDFAAAIFFLELRGVCSSKDPLQAREALQALSQL